MKPFRTIAFDIGANLGFAIAVNGVIVRSGTYNAKYSDEPWPRALLRLEKWLWDNIGDAHSNYTNHIVYEEGLAHSPGAVYAAHSHGKILGIIMVLSACMNSPIYGYKTSTVKKVFSGKGNANKLEMCGRAHCLGWKSGRVGTDKDNDEADACAIIFTHHHKLGLATSFYNREDNDNGSQKEDRRA